MIIVTIQITSSAIRSESHTYMIISVLHKAKITKIRKIMRLLWRVIQHDLHGTNLSFYS